MPFIEIQKDNGEIIQWNTGGRKFGELTRTQRRLNERTGRLTRRPHNNRKGGRLRSQKLQQRQVNAYNRLMRLQGVS